MTSIDLGGLYRDLGALLGPEMKYCVDVEWWNHRHGGEAPAVKAWVQWADRKDKSYEAATTDELLAIIRAEMAKAAPDVEVTL